MNHPSPRLAISRFEYALAPLDRIRARLYRLAGPWVSRWVCDRELRVAVLGLGSVLIALFAALMFPLGLLALGPIVFGVPHVLADVRYAWIQPGFHRHRLVWLLVVPLILAGGVSGKVVWGLGAAFVALFAVPCSWQRRSIGAAVLLPLMALAAEWPMLSTLLFAHVHNFIAAGLWWGLWRRRTNSHLLVLGGFLFAATLIVVGAFDDNIGWLGAEFLGRNVNHHARELAPFSSDFGTRIVILFAFAQAVHYAIWIRWFPEDARSRPSPRPFRSSYRAVKSELGVPLLVVFGGAAIAIAVWAAFDLWAARDGYLRAVVFHGHLELAAAALLFARGERLAHPPR